MEISQKWPLMQRQEVEGISSDAKVAFVDIDVRRYMQNIVVFLRMHRAVAGGVTRQATRHLELLVK